MRRSIASAVFMLASIAAAAAQEQPVAAEHPQAMPDPKACAPGERRMQTERAPQPAPPETTGSGESLSQKLARTDGVICPPNVDPYIKAPTPEAGPMPVIPPPGSPGGDPNVQPK